MPMMPSARASTLPLVLLVACGGAPGPASDDDGSGGSSTDATSAAASTGAVDPTTTAGPGDTTSAADTTTADPTTGGGEPALTYWRDIKSILDSKCGTCHRPDDIGPFALTTYDQAKTMSPVIRPSIADRTMPPWPPDNACSTYKRDLSLTDDEHDRLLAWIDLGSPEGDPADEPAPPPPDDEPPIAYDIELGVPEPYTPTALPDDYRCFLLDWPKDQPTYATGFTVDPGARAIVHHVIAFIIPPAELAPFDELDAADPGPGYPCYGGPGGEASPRARWLGFWVPGTTSGALPEGTGIMVEPGSKIALQMHYHPLGDDTSDQSIMRVRTATTVERPAYLLPLANPGWMVHNPEMTIEAGDPDSVHDFQIGLSLILQYLYNSEAPGFGKPMLVHAAGVHMHTRGVRASLEVIRQGGSPGPCLVDVPRWDFNWQGTYDLTEPVLVNTADQVRLECHHDNSKGDTPMKWGEGTGDEMCLGMLYVSAPSP